MKIVALSDTHGSYFIDKIPECDILLISGDISPVDLDHTFYMQQQWFHGTFINQLKECKDKAKNIVFIAGNHDTYLSEVNISDGHSNRINSYLPDNVHYLCDEHIEINGIRIYGSPWCTLPKWARPGPPVWNFAADESKLADIYSNIPNNIDILITHGPAFGFCDVILDTPEKPVPLDRLGSKSLIERIIKISNESQYIKYVLSGHIHSANHFYEIYKATLDSPGTRFACTSILNEEYKFCDLYRPLIINYNEQVKNYRG